MMTFTWGPDCQQGDSLMRQDSTQLVSLTILSSHSCPAHPASSAA